MDILLVKLSSLGDLLHTLPALSDLQEHIPDVHVDWIVEDAFKEVPAWHPVVNKVIPIHFRRLKQQGFWRLNTLKEFFRLLKTIRAKKYDYIIDAQGLYKSALLARLARGRRMGLAKGASRENVAWLYQHSFFTSWKLHAVVRLRELFSQAFKYTYNPASLNYQLGAWHGQHAKTLVFIHATTWPTKHYPVAYWHELAKQATKAGWQIVLPQVNAIEERRAHEIIQDIPEAQVLPKMTLTAIRDYLREVRAFISVDTGLAHIAAAMGVPGLALYGPTNPQNVGTYGLNQEHLAAIFECAPCWQYNCTHPERVHPPSPPCFGTLPSERVWNQFVSLLVKTRS
jgi:heptosyltransferase I